jgi:hypothetical protein
MTPPLTKETQALLALILPPTGVKTTPSTDALYAAVQPLHALIHQVATRIADVQQARRLADAAETADYAYAFFNRIKNVLEGMDRELKAAEHAIDALTESSFQLDGYALAMQESLDTHDARRAAEAAATVPESPATVA